MEKRRAIYDADGWHVDDGVATDGSGRPPVKNPVRRSFSPEYKLSGLDWRETDWTETDWKETETS